MIPEKKLRSISPTILKAGEYRFFFFSREEPRMHVHVAAAMGECKFWLEPEIELAHNYRFSRARLKEIEELVEEHWHEFIAAWRKHFG